MLSSVQELNDQIAFLDFNNFLKTLFFQRSRFGITNLVTMETVTLEGKFISVL